MSIPSLNPQGTYGTSRDVPWYNPLSHLSIPSLIPQMTYGISRDIPWCPSAQCSVPPVHPIPQSPRDMTYGTLRDVPWCPSAQSSVPRVHPFPQSPRDIWDIKGCPMVSLSTILCPTCPSIEFPCTILYFKNITHPTQDMYQTRMDSSVLNTAHYPILWWRLLWAFARRLIGCGQTCLSSPLHTLRRLPAKWLNVSNYTQLTLASVAKDWLLTLLTVIERGVNHIPYQELRFVQIWRNKS